MTEHRCAAVSDELVLHASEFHDVRVPAAWRARMADTRRSWLSSPEHLAMMMHGCMSLQVFYLEDGVPKTAVMSGPAVMCPACLQGALRGVVKHFDAYAWHCMTGGGGIGLATLLWQGEHMGERDTLTAFMDFESHPKWLRSAAAKLAPVLVGETSDVKAARATWRVRERNGKEWRFRSGEFANEAARITDELIAGIRNNAPGGEA